MSDADRDNSVKRPIGRRALLAALGAGAGAVMAATAAQAADVITGGPKELLISYRCEAENRPAFRAWLAGEMSLFLGRLVDQGTLVEWQILFNPFTSTGTWDAMLVMSFKTYAETQAWKIIERTRPGGLSQAALKLGQPIQTYCCDLPWHGVAQEPGPVGPRVAYCIPYEYNAAGAYSSYVDAYVVPQVEGWIKEGIISRYRLYLNRFNVGPPWDSYFIYEYRDMDAFGRREEVLLKVREPLKADPTWAHLNEIKSTLRTESENTVADILSWSK